VHRFSDSATEDAAVKDNLPISNSELINSSYAVTFDIMQKESVSISVLQAIRWAKEAWGFVTPETIRHCWVRSGLLTQSIVEELRLMDAIAKASDESLRQLFAAIDSLGLGREETSSVVDFLSCRLPQLSTFLMSTISSLAQKCQQLTPRQSSMI
jgi:hypothetical protein